ncbi:MAG TPA: helix-turn-helix domain-containing protein [Aldersonia sp.]
MAANCDELTDDVVTAIRRNAPSYASFPLERHRTDSRYGVSMIVTGLRDGTQPTPEALRHAETIGRDRASFGIPLVDAIEGYHVVYRELWNYLLTRAIRQGPEVTSELSHEVSLLWTWVHRSSSAFAVAHSAETARAQINRQEMRSRLVSLLHSDAPPVQQVSAVATALGFDPRGDFQSLCTDPTTAAAVDVVNDRLTGTPAHCALDTAERAVVIGQNIDANATAAMLRDLLDVRVGIGTRGSGIGGAAASLADAASALAACTPSRPVVDFTEEWPAALLVSQPHRIAYLVATGLTVARENPHLAAAVSAFLVSRFSVTATAGRLHIHPNTAKYRLDRWAQLTGWDVFTPDGLAASRITVTLAEADGGSPESAASL